MARLAEIPSNNCFSKPHERILYEAGGALGDATIELRDLLHIRSKFPEAKIVVKLPRAELASLFSEAGFDEYIIPKFSGTDDPFYNLRVIESSDCDAVYHSFGGAFNARIEYINFDGVSLPRRPVNKGTLGYFWGSDEFPHVMKGREEFLRELLCVSPPDRDQIRLPKVELSGELKILIDSFISHCKSTERIVLISVSSSVDPRAAIKGNRFPKTCSTEKWVSVAEDLTAMGYGVIFTGGIKGQNVYGHNLKPGMLNLIEMLDLKELRGVMSYAPKVVVGGDSGPGHLASIMGIPTVSVFPSNGCPEYWSPGYAPNISLVSPTLHPDGVDNRLVIEAIEQMIKS